MTVAGKTITVHVESTDNVKVLMEKIQKVEGLPPKVQKLLFEGKQLEEGKTLADYEIINESTLHLFIRLPGGCLVVR